MVTAAKKISQVITHTSIAFAITYWVTGSFVFGGLAALLEPIINVMLLPSHGRLWEKIRRSAKTSQSKYLTIASEKVSQTLLHMAVAFAVMYWATGSLAFGGLAAVLEPICNVIALPFHDRAWEKLRARLDSAGTSQPAICNAVAK
jgi:uncharacterized membrane protein